jgi:hypothetical protein
LAKVMSYEKEGAVMSNAGEEWEKYYKEESLY